MFALIRCEKLCFTDPNNLVLQGSNKAYVNAKNSKEFYSMSNISRAIFAS